MGRKKIFKIKVLRWLENAIFNSVLASKGANLLIVQAEFAVCMKDILSYPESTMVPPWLGPEKNCQNESSRMAGKALVFANTVNASFNYTSFQLLYEHYVAFNPQKLPDFDDVMTQFYLNFLKLRKLGVVTATGLSVRVYTA